MKSIVKAIGIAAAAALVVLGPSARANAGAILYFSPAAQTVNSSVTDTVDVDVWLSGAPLIGGWDIDVSFDDTVLAADALTVDTSNFGGLFFGLSSFDFPYTGTSPVNSFAVGDPAGANDGSGTPFKLFTITFKTLVLEGKSNLDITYKDLSDELGTSLVPASAEGGVICVARLGSEAPGIVADDPGCTRSVPEPGLLALLGAGLSAAAARRRLSKRS